MADLASFDADVSSLEAEVQSGNEKVKEVKRLMARCSELQTEVKGMSIAASKKLKLLRKSAKSLDVSAADKVAEIERLDNIEETISGFREIRSETGSFFARIFLGRINLRVLSQSDRIRLRDEYNKFRIRTSFIYLLFPLVVMFFHYYLRYVWKDTHWINIFYVLWLLYYYVSLALRENILLLNGSNIRRWWIIHHYLAAMTNLVFLVWPATDTYEDYVPYYTTFAFYNGIVMILQNIYHKRTEYANRALGKINHMDVTYQETITDLPKAYAMLLPFLIIAQVWQTLLGAKLLRTFLFELNLEKRYWTEYREEIQIFTAAVLQLIMGLGNMYATLRTSQQKWKRSKVAKSD